MSEDSANDLTTFKTKSLSTTAGIINSPTSTQVSDGGVGGSAAASILLSSTPINANFNSTILNNLNASGIPNSLQQTNNNNSNPIAVNMVTSGGGGGGNAFLTSNVTIGTNNNSNSGGGCSSTAQSILQNRANMKSSDLAKEKANTQRLHRNILPKPSSSSSAGMIGLNCSPIGGVSAAVAACTIPVSSFAISSTNSHTIGTTSSTGMITLPTCFNQSNNCNNKNIGQMNLTNNSAAASIISQQQPILNSYLTAAATVQQQLGEMLNGHHNLQLNQTNNINNQQLMIGRQGVFKDVKSIIAEYKQRHPEIVPRRGRRMKGNVLSNLTTAEANSILGNVLKGDGKLGSSDLGMLLTKFDGNSRPSSNDSSHSMTNVIGNNNNNSNTNFGNVSFKDVLVQFAKMSGQVERLGSSTVPTGKTVTQSTVNTMQTTAPPPYPEVTLHPVSTTQSSGDQTTGSLLHGILTKYTRQYPSSTSTATATSTTQTSTTQPYNSSFSPTLARLLTAPERITSAHNNQQISGIGSGLGNGIVCGGNNNNNNNGNSNTTTGLNLSKVVGHNSEITITPVVSSQSVQQTLLQQQLQNQQQIKDAITRDRVKTENYLNLDDEADDSVDRLVIDEGGDSSIGAEEQHRIAPHAIGQEFHENEVPVCQGCKKQEAQFVCAGCGNQWYCSRECQVGAWDEHSEVCTG